MLVSGTGGRARMREVDWSGQLYYRRIKGECQGGESTFLRLTADQIPESLTSLFTRVNDLEPIPASGLFTRVNDLEPIPAVGLLTQVNPRIHDLVIQRFTRVNGSGIQLGKEALHPGDELTAQLAA
jgi:hypothetical protein